MASWAARPYMCARCASTLLRPPNRTRPTIGSRRSYATKSSDATPTPPSKAQDAASNPSPPSSESESELGPMARRLQEATEDALLTGGRAGRRAVEDAGFSDELKERLLAKVKDAQFRSENAAAFAEAGLSTAASEETRMNATSRPWTGQESTEDAVLRMLTDAHKPLKRELRGRPKIAELQPVDMRMRQRANPNPSVKAANARDKASIYVGMGMKESGKGLSEKERADLREELRERFRPAARAMPNTLSGLASLANERIEDAISRGQFKNIPRGKDVERDARSDNPFVDTTEYIMNKMIKRQDIVPPWIEKQQELAKAAHVFRARLRNDWRRHAARTIASKGGSLEAQMERAEQYAKAEKALNPRKGNVEQMAIPTNSTDDVVMVKIRQQQSSLGSPSTSAEAEISEVDEGTSEPEVSLLQPLRDPDWLRIEQAYMDLSIKNLNTLARSYNLMAPELAKKPYFSLERELNNCYADVAPLLPNEIKVRATRPSKPLVDSIADRPGSILDRFGNQGVKAKVYESKTPHYGLKEFWRDLFN
ncbi:hypothetical protein F4808DRAFT_243176 [Astrocystis sublimbata]|nr:hypothetical protein F4808DRAFT_243176 [Astrocystis sublimbata]